MIYEKIVHYKHEIFLLKQAEPNQVVEFVRYNREFVITVIVITEFDCSNVCYIFKCNFAKIQLQLVFFAGP